LILVCMNLARWLSFFKFSPAPILPDLYEASIRDLQAGLDRGHFSSVHLVQVRTRPLHFSLHSLKLSCRAILPASKKSMSKAPGYAL
jgi:hypothetical protein